MGRTYEALLRAEKKFKKVLNQKKSLENIEPLLIDLGLGETQVLSQTSEQLKQSLARIDGLIQKQESTQENQAGSDLDNRRIALQVLLKRKELVLGCLDLQLTSSKNDEIRKLVAKIADEKIKSALIGNLDDLEKLTHFFTKAHLKILKSKNRIFG